MQSTFRLCFQLKLLFLRDVRWFNPLHIPWLDLLSPVSVCLSRYLLLCLCLSFSLSLSVFLALLFSFVLYQSFSLFLCVSLYLSVSLSFCLSVSLSLLCQPLSLPLSVCLPTCLPAYLSACLPICLSLSSKGNNCKWVNRKRRAVLHIACVQMLPEVERLVTAWRNLLPSSQLWISTSF